MKVELNERERKIIYELLFKEFKQTKIKSTDLNIQNERIQKMSELSKLIDKI